MGVRAVNQSITRQPVAILFITTAFPVNLCLYLVGYPVWWLLGIEQILLPLFLLIEAGRYALSLVVSRRDATINPPLMWALFLAIWWLLPGLYIENQPVFLKTLNTAWSQVFILFLLWNTVRAARDWRLIESGLAILAVYVAVGCFVYALGLWRGTYTSLIAQFLPESTADSEFFRTITLRDFGTWGGWLVDFLPYRLSSFALKSTDLSLLCPLLIALVSGKLLSARGVWRVLWLIVLSGLLIGLVYAQVRIAYLGGLIGLGLAFIWSAGLLRSHNRLLLVALNALFLAAMLFTILAFMPLLIELFQAAFVEARAGSWQVRRQIYAETIRLFGVHPIVGWGEAARIPNLPSTFSAGTHGDYLSVLFQQGLVGFGLYVALWASIWRRIARLNRGAAFQGRPSGAAIQCRFLSIALLVFNFQIIFSDWRWDQTVTIAVWCVWGLLLTAPQTILNRGAAHG